MTTEIAVLTVSLVITALYALGVIAFRNFKGMNAARFHDPARAPARWRRGFAARHRSYNQQGFPGLFQRR